MGHRGKCTDEAGAGTGWVQLGVVRGCLGWRGSRTGVLLQKRKVKQLLLGITRHGIHVTSRMRSAGWLTCRKFNIISKKALGVHELQGDEEERNFNDSGKNAFFYLIFIIFFPFLSLGYEMTSSTLCSPSLPCCPSAPCPAQALRKAAARSGGARGGLRAPSAVPAGSEPPGVGQGRILVPTIPSAALQGPACAPCLAAPRGHQPLLALCSPGDGDGQLRENCPCLMAAPPLGGVYALCR